MLFTVLGHGVLEKEHSRFLQGNSQNCEGLLKRELRNIVGKLSHSFWAKEWYQNSSSGKITAEERGENSGIAEKGKAPIFLLHSPILQWQLSKTRAFTGIRLLNNCGNRGEESVKAYE